MYSFIIFFFFLFNSSICLSVYLSISIKVPVYNVLGICILHIPGAQMILSMKIISLAFDFGNGVVIDLPNIFEYLGYCLNVGTVIFGPWISYKEYIGLLQPNRLYFVSF